MTPAERLRARADALEAEGRALQAQRKYKEAAGREVMAALLRATADEMAAEAKGGLPVGNRYGNKGRMVSTAARLRISEATGGEDGPDPLVLAANAAGYTLRSLGEAVGVSHAMLSQARSGDKALREDVALHVQKLTGFKATRKNWPKGWARPRK